MKVFTSLFSKSDRRSNARSVGRLRRGEISLAAFLFCQAREALAPPGGVKRSQFSFGPSVSKKKAGNRFKKCLRAKGNSLRECEVPPPLAQWLRGTPHLCGSPLPSRGSAFTLLWRFGRIREFRPLRRATADRGGSDELLKKLEQNFPIRQRRGDQLTDKSKFENTIKTERSHFL